MRDNTTDLSEIVKGLGLKEKHHAERVVQRPARPAPEKTGKKEAARKKPLHYVGIAIFLLTIVYVVDEITSNINAAMQPYAFRFLHCFTSFIGTLMKIPLVY